MSNNCLDNYICHECPLCKHWDKCKLRDIGCSKKLYYSACVSFEEVEGE